tara:strand:- start:575 stop:1069 length:495 start_codon:yes stop_codon:yes gene_type:complete
VKDNGENVVIKGVLYRDGNDGDIYSSKSSTKSTFEAIGSETITQSSQTVVQAVVTQAQNIGASGLIAMGSGVYFQADAVVNNAREAIQIAKPMVEELVETGTITPPEGSKFAGVEIPKTTSFFGVKVGEGKQELTKEQQEFQDAVRQSVTPNGARKAQREASQI